MDKTRWHRSYPPYVPREISLDDHETLNSMLERSFARYAERTVATCLGEMLTYADLNRLSTYFAAFLQQSGLTKGDRVALVLPNGLPFLVAMTATLRAGFIVAAVNPLYTPRELAQQLSDSGAACVVVAEAFLPILREALPQPTIRRIVIAPPVGLREVARRLDSSAANATLVSRGASPGQELEIDLAAALEAGRQVPIDATKVEPTDISFLQYTSGTTGVSKGAMLTQRSMAASVSQILAGYRTLLEGGAPSVVTPLPLYHIYPLAMTFAAICIGMKNRLIVDPRDVQTVVGEMCREPFEMFLGVNTLFNSLASAADFGEIDFSRTRLVFGAGAPVQDAVARRWSEAGGPAITECYGLTEASPTVSLNPPGSSGTIGLPAPSTDVRIVNAQGQEVELGEAGELLVKGPQTFAGYWNRADATHEAFTSDGWLRTGDVVSMTADGYMHLVDRKKDLILVSGFNVYPNEIETVVMMLPDVHECACVGVADERTGEAPCLYVVPKCADVTVEQIMIHCRKNLAAYKIPRHISMVTSLPKSAVGKILRKDLRQQHESRLR
ncbi:AMP-binding protein [Paraburkholderia sp. EG286B]|uniref:AMP-binding protein n=1 Tax=Paraburkholderia sp. EG286B TaxID=3237011 RepID=UPI0034D1BE7B